MKQNHLFLLLRRLAAFLYDSMLLLALFFLTTAIAIAFNDGQAIETHIFKLLLLPVTCFFYIWFWKHGGQTLGMSAWRIKLVNNKTNELTFYNCITRFCFGLIFFGITFCFMFFNKRGDALHDFLSGTSITHEKRNK